MRRFLILLILIAPWNFVFAKAQPPPYCEGHAKKVIDILVPDPTGEILFNAVQAELNRYSESEIEYSYNNRYELCFDLFLRGDSTVLQVGGDRTLTLTNTTPREVVIGFLNANRSDDSATPIIEVHGSKVTIFQPTFSNVKKAIVFEGNRHKLVGGTINGVPSAADSLCVDGAGNNIQIKDATISDCPNGISLNGNGNKVEDSIFTFSRSTTAPPASNYDLDNPTAEEQYWADFGTWLNNNFTADGTCLNMNGDSGVIKNVAVDYCDGISVKVSGRGYSILNSQIAGHPVPEKSGLTRHSTDCLRLQGVSNVTLHGNTISQCRIGVHVPDSQAIYIGPERFEDFAAKKNDIHHNDYAIHAERSQTVYARHNQVYENGKSLPEEEAYNFGFWPVDSNLVAGENRILRTPKMEPTDGHEVAEDELEYPVVKYDASGNAFVDVKVPTQTGKVELGFPYIQDADDLHGRLDKERYQPHTPFGDCAFENVTIESDGFGKVRCPIQVTNEIKGKRLLAILHGNPVGSSQYAKALGIINDPTTETHIGTSMPSTGNMTGQSVAGGGVSGGNALGGGAGRSDAGGVPSSCQLRPSQKFELSEILLCYTLVILVTSFVIGRRLYGYARQGGEQGRRRRE